MDLTPDQQTAVDSLAATKSGVLVGRAGCGKTVSANGLVNKLATAGRVPVLTAPTHKAARVLAGKTGRDVSTIHSVLKLVPVPNYTDGGRTLRSMGDVELDPRTVLIIDEASMLPPHILNLLAELDVPVVLIGDEAQLPPVGYSEPCFLDWAKGRGMPKHSLTEIIRQAGDNTIPYEAAKWRPGAPRPEWPTQDNKGEDGGIMVLGRDKASRQFAMQAKKHYDATGNSDTVRPWLCYTNAGAQAQATVARKEIFGRVALFEPFLAGELCILGNPITSTSTSGNEATVIMPTSMPVRIMSDPVKETRVILGEEWDVYTLEIMAEDSFESHEVSTMTFEARKCVLDGYRSIAMNAMAHGSDAAIRMAWKDYYDVEDAIVDLRTCYSSTVHKSQGSGYPDVFLDKVDMDNMYAASIRNQLVYTAMTRPYRYAVIAR